MTKEDELTAGLRAELARVNARLAQQEGRDWSLLEATQESLREHMAEIKRLKAAQPAPVQESVGEVLVKVARFLGVVRVYAQDIQPKHELETDKPLHWKARELQDEVIRLIDTAPPAPQPVPVKTYSGGKPWPVAPAPDPAPIIQQLVTALEGSGTRMRSDQWYIEIEAVAAGKRYLNEMALLGREKMDEEHRAGFDGPPED
jgi:hypothetical protein